MHFTELIFFSKQHLGKQKQPKATYLITSNRYACTYFFHGLMNQSIIIMFKNISQGYKSYWSQANAHVSYGHDM